MVRVKPAYLELLVLLMLLQLLRLMHLGLLMHSKPAPLVLVPVTPP